jgi:hypothetical protein
MNGKTDKRHLDVDLGERLQALEEEADRLRRHIRELESSELMQKPVEETRESFARSVEHLRRLGRQSEPTPSA